MTPVADIKQGVRGIGKRYTLKSNTVAMKLCKVKIKMVHPVQLNLISQILKQGKSKLQFKHQGVAGLTWICSTHILDS